MSNRDLLREIHKSKASFSWFEEPRFADFHAACDGGPEDITDGVVAAARKKAGPGADLLVVRCMTSSHLPRAPDGERRRGRRCPEAVARRHEEGAVQVGFPPFRHWAADAAAAAAGTEGGWREVGRSHWTGGPGGGRFEPEGGRVTDGLARLVLKLVARMARRANWRNYSWVDDMVAQAAMHLMTAALKFDCTRSSNPFAYLTTVSHNVFIRYVAQEKRLRDTRDDLLIMAGQAPSFGRQVEHEMAEKAAADPGAVPAGGDRSGGHGLESA